MGTTTLWIRIEEEEYFLSSCFQEEEEFLGTFTLWSRIEEEEHFLSASRLG